MITVGIASIPSRSAMLEQVLDSLVGQADQIFVGLNYGDEPAPMYLDKYSNVFWWTTHNHHGDAEKFAMAQNCEGYYVSWDDDLIAKPWTIQKLKTACEKYNGVVGFHGKVFGNYPIKDYHKDFTENYRCLNSVKGDHLVDVIGSGCTCWDVRKFKVRLDDFKTKNMGDVWLSFLAHQQKVPLWVIEHKREIVEYTNPRWTIWKNSPKTGKETEVVNEILRLKNN